MASESPPLFPELSAKDLEVIAQHGVRRQYPKGAILINEGESGSSFYIIHRGTVKVFVSGDQDKEVLLNVQGPGEYFGELALIDDAPRSASVITQEAAEITVVSKSDFRRCLSEYPEIAVELIRALVKRVRALTDSVKSLASRRVYGRLTHALESLATYRNGVGVISPKPKHREFAEMVGASREMVSRVMRDLIDGGYIRVEKDSYVIVRKLPAGW